MERPIRSLPRALDTTITQNPRAEATIALVAFALAAVAVFRPGAGVYGAPSVAAVALLFALLVGAYFAFSVGVVVRALQDAVRRLPGGALAGPAVLWLAVVLYAALSGVAVPPRAGAFAAYLFAPALLVMTGLTPPGRPPVRELFAVLLLWLPVELRLLPHIPVPSPGGYDVARFVGLVDALFLFLIVRPLPDVGYTFALRRRDVVVALLVFVVYAAVALPVGLATGFIAWRPTASSSRGAVTPLLIYLGTGVPEEFLFRGLIQNLLRRWCGPARAMVAAAAIFGLAHLPDPRYVLLAAIAGLAYGWTYQRTGRITASAVTHALVDAAWVILLRR